MLVRRFESKRNGDKAGFQWTAESEIERPGFYRGLTAVGNRDTYLGNLKKPRILEIVERMDADHGTGITKPTRDVLLMTAFFAASVDGKGSQEKAAEIARMGVVFGSGK